MAIVIGPNFGNELAAAFAPSPIPPMSWSANGVETYGPAVTTAQKATVATVLAAHNPAKPDPNAAYAAAIAAGVQIVSAGTAVLTGTWGIAAQDEINISSLQAGIAASATWLGWARDKAGGKHVMTAPQFTALAIAILGYVEALDEALVAALSGGSWSPPAQPTNIA